MSEDTYGSLITSLAMKNDKRIVLLVLDGLGDVPGQTGRTALQDARKPNLDALAGKSACGLLATLPLWPLIALAIWLDSRGTLFFKQARAFSMETLESIYHRLLIMDEAAKTGVMPLDMALDTFIVENRY